MKENFFNKIKNSVKNAISFDENDEYIDDDEEYEDDESSFMEDSATAPSAPAGYSFANDTSKFQAASYTPYNIQPAPAPSSPKFGAGKKGSANIYAMPDAKKSGKLKVSLFVLNDTDDARNVADSMIERSVVTICDMTRISITEERRVLDFLDGVKYVCNSIIENISEHIYLIVPEAAELTGDFFSQVEY